MWRARTLGHVSDDGIIRSDPEEIEAVAEFLIPQTIQKFMGSTNYYPRFVKNFADITSLINKFLTKSPDSQPIRMGTKESTSVQGGEGSILQ